MSQSQIEYACKELVFHFNKKHLEDPSIPMWVLKTQGESLYVNHVDCRVPWSTKETADNPHTKGSIKIKNCLLTIDKENTATIKELSLFDKVRLRNQKLGISRIMFSDLSFERALKDDDIKHSPFKRIYAPCSTAYTVCDILDKNDALMMGIKYPGKFRVLMPNESYYQAYDDKKLWEKMQRDYDEGLYPDDDDDNSF